MNSPINLKDPSGLYSVGEYVSDVGGVFVGYGKAIWGTLTAPFALYNHFNENGLSWESAKDLVAGGVQALGQGLGSSDPREFGEAFGTVLLMAAPGLKKVPSLRGTRTPCEVPTSIYAPQRSLPSSKHGVKIPDSPYPHTQLGKQSGRRGEYVQAREWGENGQVVRDIDFTDHGRPFDHSNPHQHLYDLKTGKRGSAQPFKRIR